MKESVSTAPVREALEADLRTLREVGAIDEDQARRLHTAAARGDPGVAGTGVIHKDLCPENLVVGPDGVLNAVDNEWMTVGPTGPSGTGRSRPWSSRQRRKRSRRTCPSRGTS